MNGKRVKILRKAYLKLMQTQGASAPKTRGTWKRFKQAYNEGRLTPQGQLIRPKQPSIKRRRLISLTEVGVE